MKYAMSDIHGCYEEFLEMLDLIHFSDSDELYIIGDIVDRGPDPLSMIYYVMAHENIHMLEGNHEQMMLATITDAEPLYPPSQNEELWYSNGGEVTHRMYLKLSESERNEIISFFKAVPLVCEVRAGEKDYILIHGGPYRRFAKDFAEGHVSDNVLWERFYSLSEDAPEVVPGKITVVGHTPIFTYYGHEDCKPVVVRDKRLIDGGCVFGGKLNCMCLDTEEYFSVPSRQRKVF